jgi:uncharacterized phage-associated protein
MSILSFGPYDAKAVANYFLELAQKEGKTIDPLGIQALVYFAHGWSLAFYGRPLISQRIEAGPSGPIIRDLYEDFSKFGYAPITEPALRWNIAPGSSLGVKAEYPQVTDADTISLLIKVWDAYKGFTSIQLSNMTHDPGSPWKTAINQHQRVIDDSLLQQYFSSQVNAA